MPRAIVRFTTALVFLLPCLAPAQEKPCKPTVTGHLDIQPLTSNIFHNKRSLRVWLPAGYDDTTNPPKRYKVLYILDGQDAFDKCTSSGQNMELRADEALTELIEGGKIEPIIAVGVDSPSDSSQRAREFLPYPDSIAPLLGQPRVPDVHGEQFPEFLESEVFPVIAAKYRILTGRNSTAILGVSYGGVAAVYAMVHRPDLFGSGIVQSPSVQVGNGQLVRDTASLTYGPTRVWFDVGTVQDVPVKGVAALVDNFKAIAVFPPEVQFTVGEGHKHNIEDFGKRLPAALVFLYGSKAAK
jgi:predicted alpha/beta superfamily hydrolase